MPKPKSVSESTSKLRKLRSRARSGQSKQPNRRTIHSSPRGEEQEDLRGRSRGLAPEDALSGEKSKLFGTCRVPNQHAAGKRIGVDPVN